MLGWLSFMVLCVHFLVTTFGARFIGDRPKGNLHAQDAAMCGMKGIEVVFFPPLFLVEIFEPPLLHRLWLMSSELAAPSSSARRARGRRVSP